LYRALLLRFLLPQLLLLGALGATVAIVAAVQVGQDNGRIAPLVWTALAATAVTVLCSWWIAHRFTSRHLQEIAQLFSAAIPDASQRPSFEGDRQDVIHDIARTFRQLMSDALEDQAQFSTVISSMSDGLVATDDKQRIVLTNDAARDLLTFRQAEVLGKQLWEVIPLEGVLQTVTEVSLTGVRKTVHVGPVSGRHIDVTVTRLPLRPAGFIIVAHDVSETMRYEELRKEFVANVSHELRTPLTVIKGYVETLIDGALDDRPRAMQYLETVHKHAEQLAELVEDLLSLSRLDSSPSIPNPRLLLLGRVAAKVVDLLGPAAAKKEHRIGLRISDGLQPVLGSPDYLERAVSNLVENAIKYTPEGGLIRIVVREEGGRAILEVVDNGVGIAADDVPHIFERFYRAERSRSRDMGGTGLGLSIVKHIAQAHGGSVEVDTAPGAGSTFRLRLPVAPDEAGPPAVADDPAA
jgi:two-component system phosphate regulon sensor histidine kinase PhoR